ncbi:hypothetical protein FOMPIDRAFT_1056463 [Fomitopsis schrenkii]|uniref:Uncharacterized protein n=1 Tax=Fomitopsis schrenkii TaxID=2126942 RepID=S8F1J3_FOMSC|nr:hypothetical protein FOMPIDRAFT_1056463 [Fomitopsis schrenkii]
MILVPYRPQSQGDNPPKIKTLPNALHFGLPGAARIARNVKACVDTFAERWNIPSAALYIGLWSSLYCEWMMKGLAADPNVPCKKPVAVNAAKAYEMFDYAVEKDLVLLEV